MSPRNERRSPLVEGFAMLGREPMLLPAELMWRWCFGFSAWGLIVISGALFLDSLKISRADEFLINSVQPKLMSTAVAHVLRGSLARLTWMQMVLLLGLTLLWAAVAAVGRAASLHRMLALVRSEDVSSEYRWHFPSMFVLALLRCVWTYTALAGFVASLLLGTAMVQQQRAASASFFFVFGTSLACVSGFLLNWWFGLALLFCVRDGMGASEAIAGTMDFCERKGGRVFGLSLAFLMLRAVWMGTMFMAFLAPLRLAGKVNGAAVVAMMTTIAIAYFAGADVLYLARLGAYVTLAEETEIPEAVAQPEPERVPPMTVEMPSG